MLRKRIFSIFAIFTLAACTIQPAAPAATQTSHAPTATATSVPATNTPTALEPTSTSTREAKPITTASGAWIKLSPDSGAPGSTVQIDGFLPGGPGTAESQDGKNITHANVCWQSCLEGFVETSQQVEWSQSEPGSFKLEFIVSPIPWLGEKGVQAMNPGDYSVSLQCLGGELSGCALLEGQPEATFHLSGPASEQCQSGQACASLNFVPAQAEPGVEVNVKGWAPLVSLVDGQPFGYNLVFLAQGENGPAQTVGQVSQDLQGNISGSFQVPQQLISAGEIQPGSYNLALQAFTGPPGSGKTALVAVTPFEVTQTLTWSDLKLSNPLWVQPSADLIAPEISADSGSPQRMAYCATGGIQVSLDGGISWSSVPVEAVKPAAEDSGYPLFIQGGSSEQPACLTVTMDALHPSSYFAVFQAMDKQFGAPPVFFMGYFTTDGGFTWSQVPAPPGANAETFGGFWSDGQGIVQALFSPENNQSGESQPPLVEQSGDGGKNWSAAALICPASGPCVRWGAAPAQIPGMGSPLPQFVFVSNDGGNTWTDSGLSVELRMGGPNELAAFSDTQAALLASGSDYPVQTSQDGGKTWQVVGLPGLPVVTGAPLDGLQILPDGSLIAQPSDNSAWLRLPSGADRWCDLSPGLLPAAPTRLQTAGSQVWWLNPSSQEPGSSPSADLKCSG
jgi:hypothetical protein